MAFTLDVAGLQQEMTENVYRNLTREEGSAEWSIEKAKSLVRAKFENGGYTDILDFDNQVTINATLQYAKYYLYMRINNTDTGIDARSDGNVLLSSIIGNYAFDVPQSKINASGGNGSGGGDLRNHLQSKIKVTAGTKHWNNFNRDYYGL